MSQENVEIVRRADDAFLAGVAARGDFGAGFDTGANSEDLEFIAAAETVERRSYRGREGLVEFGQTWTENFERYSLGRRELIDAGNGRVFASYWQSGVGRGSGVPVEVESFAVFELVNGQIIRIRMYLDRAEALEAAGLRE
jgi:ketosteroid isomerase-like protein